MNLERHGREPEMYPIPDQNFKLSSVHHFVLNFAKEREGVYSLKQYRAYLREKMPDAKRREQTMRWNATTVRRMLEAGYLVDIGREEYLVNPLIHSLDGRKKQAFELKENHRKLLAQHQDGIITLAALKQPHQHKPEHERYRQGKMIEGMVRNLVHNGYLEALERGQYQLTNQALLTLTLPPPEKGQRAKKQAPEVKVTAFDRHLLDICEEGQINPLLLAAHTKGESLKKRIATLTAAGLIKDGKISPQLWERIELAQARAKSRGLSLDKLTEKQKQALMDMRIFLNLSFSQIVKHIYDGDKELAKQDLQYLLDKDIFRKDPDWHIYILGKNGIELSNPLFPDQVRYKTKLYSRREEVGHDVLVYSAYKDFERRLLAEGKQIISIKNDRQMRSEDARAYGAMTGSYPDLRVKYYDPALKKELTHDLEVDCGYDEKTIAKKLAGAGGNAMSWYANNINQARRIIRAANKQRRDKRKPTAHLSIYAIDEQGHIHKMKWW